MYPTWPVSVICSKDSSTTIILSVGGACRLPFSSSVITPSLPDSEAPKLSRRISSGLIAAIRSRTCLDQIAPPEVIENSDEKSAVSFCFSISSTSGMPMASPTMRMVCVWSRPMFRTICSALKSRSRMMREPSTKKVNRE